MPYHVRGAAHNLAPRRLRPQQSARSQDTPPIKRLDTVPAGTTLVIERLNLRLETPCDLPTKLEPDDEIAVSKKGYYPFRGPIGDLPEIARGTYRLELQASTPRAPAQP